MYQFKFADIGEGLHEGKVVKIHVKVGDSVKDGDVLFEVETDKVTSEITSPVNGKIFEIKIQEEATIHVGDVAFVIDDSSSSTNAPKEESKPAAGGASVVGQVVVSDELLSFDFGSKKKNTSTITNKTNPTHVGNLQPLPKGLKIAPRFRKIAAEKGIDLNLVVPTGPNNTVLEVDLEKALSASKNNVQASASNQTPTQTHVSNQVMNVTKPNNGFVAKRVKTTAMREAIAKNLKNSWNQVAYVNLVIQVNVTKLWDLRNNIKDTLLKTTGTKITFLPFIAKATTIALSEFPIFTAQYDEKTQELVYPDTINLGIAVDTDYGLVVPNIKDAQTKSVLQISHEINLLADAARKKTMKGSDMANGTFTITNYGSAGGLFGVPIIKYPEMGILGVGTIVDHVEVAGMPQKIMYLTIAADHRWVDGAEMGRFTSRIKQLIENPSLLSVY